jgi:hypothetical protein
MTISFAKVEIRRGVTQAERKTNRARLLKRYERLARGRMKISFALLAKFHLNRARPSDTLQHARMARVVTEFRHVPITFGASAVAR